MAYPDYAGGEEKQIRLQSGKGKIDRHEENGDEILDLLRQRPCEIRSLRSDQTYIHESAIFLTTKCAELTRNESTKDGINPNPIRYECGDEYDDENEGDHQRRGTISFERSGFSSGVHERWFDEIPQHEHPGDRAEDHVEDRET